MRPEGLRYKSDGGLDCATFKLTPRRSAKVIMSEGDREGSDNPNFLRSVVGFQKIVGDMRLSEKSRPLRPRINLLRMGAVGDPFLACCDGLIE